MKGKLLVILVMFLLVLVPFVHSGDLETIVNSEVGLTESSISTFNEGLFNELLALSNSGYSDSYSYSLNKLSLQRDLYQAESSEVNLQVTNNQNRDLDFEIEVSSTISSLVIVKDTQFTVSSNDSYNLPLLFIISPATTVGIYDGFIKIGSGDENTVIPVRIRVQSRSFSPISLQSSLLDKVVLRGSNAIVDVLFINEHSSPIPVNVSIVLQDTNGNPVAPHMNLVKNISDPEAQLIQYKIPSSVSKDEYVLSLVGNYSYFGKTKIFQKSYVISVTKPSWGYYLFSHRIGGVFPVWYVDLLLLMGVLAYLGYLFVQRERDRHKRFHLPVDQKELAMPGPRSVRVGNLAELETPYYFEIDKLLTHSVVAGSTGGGKSVTSQVYVEEALKVGSSVIIFDPTAQWSGFLRPNKDAHMFHLYSSFGLKKSDARGFPGNIRYVTNPLEILDIKKFIQPGEITIFALNHLSLDDLDIFVSNAIRAIFDARLSESPDLRLLVVFDEIHRLLPKYGGSGNGLLQVERGCREFRKWGVGLMLISQVLTDFVGTIQANINTQIQMHSSDEHDLNRLNENFGGDIGREIIRAPVGYGMLENSAYNKGKPFFVNFRPLLHSARRLSDDELERYKKYNDVMDQYYFDLDQLKAKGVDVFDLKLELDLAFKKVKEGQFNMVDVYIEGLKPRIVDVFKSNNLERAKYVPKLAKLDDVKAAIAHAKKLQEEEQSKKKEGKK